MKLNKVKHYQWLILVFACLLAVCIRYFESPAKRHVEAIMRSESDSERVDAIRYIATNRNQLDLQQVELVLTKALGDRNLSVRRTAILLLPFYDELAKRNVDRLIKETRHDDVFVRIAALDALGSMLKRNHSDPDRSRISEAILALQNDENEAVRDYAKTVLSRPKPPG